jgi:hypothetical protein
MAVAVGGDHWQSRTKRAVATAAAPCPASADRALLPLPVLGRAAEDLVQSRWVLGDRVFPRGPAPGALGHCRGPVRSAGVPLGALGTYRDV